MEEGGERRGCVEVYVSSRWEGKLAAVRGREVCILALCPVSLLA